MDQIPLTDYQNELQSLSYSPILGNRTSSNICKSQSQIPKLNLNQPKGKSLSATSVAKTLSPANPRKRLFSETKMSPSKKSPSKKEKLSTKEDGIDIVAALATLKSDILTGMDSKLANMEEKIGCKMDDNMTQLSSQISELKTEQEKESAARKDLEKHVNAMQTQFDEIIVKIEQNTPATAESVAEAMAPQIEAAVAKHFKSKENQINATYFQSLVNDLKAHERDLMLYSFKTNGSPDLEAQVRQKVFKDILGLDVGSFKAVQVGSENRDQPKPIRVSFPSTEIRNSVCRQGHKLPKGRGSLKIEKCMPARYRQPSREFREFGWQLRESTNVQTRTIFKGHKLVLEMKQPDEGGLRYDWTTVKEYFPEPESPTDRTESTRDRQGLVASKTIEQIGANKVILSNLTIKIDHDNTKRYFENEFLDPEDLLKVEEVNTDKLVTKNLMVVTMSTQKDCTDFKAKYEKKDFNEHKARITLMLGRS